MWQEVIVGICVLAALVYVIRQYLPAAGNKEKQTGSCGGCQGCDKPAGKDHCSPR